MIKETRTRHPKRSEMWARPLASAAPPMRIDKIAIRRRVCQESYYDFCQIFWEVLIAEAPTWNWHIKVMCREVQRSAERVFLNLPKEHDLIINVPPGSTKSTVCSIYPCPWLWTRMPSLRFMGVSFGTDLALDLGNKSRLVIKSQLYRETFPEVQIREDQDTKAYFANYQGGERRSTSTGADIIGRHAHIQSVDDPINPEAALSEADLGTVNRFMFETLGQRKVNQAVTPLWLIMQRLALEDPTGTLLQMAADYGIPVRHICLPAEVSDQVKPAVFKNKYKDGLLDPVRLTKDVLKTKLPILGNYGYAGQYEQLPVPATGGMFQTDKIKKHTTHPPVEQFDQVIRWWDKAATEKKYSAYTSGVLMGVLLNRKSIPCYWVLDVIRERWDTNTREKRIRSQAESDILTWGTKYKVGIEQEPGSSGVDSALATIWNMAGFSVVAERASGDKFQRADTYSVQVNGGNVAMTEGAWNNCYIQELKHFAPASKWKDQVDASSGAFNKLFRKKIIITAGGF